MTHPTEEGAALRGCLWGLLLVAPLWALLAGLGWWWTRG